MKIKILLFAVFILSVFQMYGQEQLSIREKADALYRSYKYAYAANLYQKLTDTKKPKLRDMEQLADCYYRINDYEAAENWYSRIVLQPESNSENLLRYGEVLKNNNRYAEAKKIFQEYAAKTGSHNKVNNDIAGCDSALIWMARPTLHKIKNEVAVNTSNAEFGVFPLAEKIYYTAEPDEALLKQKDGRTGNTFLKIYTAKISNDNRLRDPFYDNNEIFNKEIYHVGPVGGNKQGTQLFITRTYSGNKAQQDKEANRKYKTNNLELFIYTLKGNGWDVQPFIYNNVKQYSVGHAALSEDEKTLYFVSDMPGGQGGTDIWYSEMQSDGSWGKPQNAGGVINTPGDEMFPNVVGNILYYSTNGRPGMGGLDIFKAEGSKSKWKYTQNMKYPVNSANDDFSYVTYGAGETGFLSSNRKGGAGNDDIYSFSYREPEIIIALKVMAYDRKTGEELEGTSITLAVDENKVEAKQLGKIGGVMFLKLDTGVNYTVLGQKDRFYADSAAFSTKNIQRSDTLLVTLRLEPLMEKGKTIKLDNIHYNFDKDDIRPDAAKILNELVRTMRDNPTLKIELASHTDSRGADVYNQDLSQRRAQSVVNYLVSRGIARSRMVAKGYGESKLLNRCANGVPCSVAEHQANRRTEFTVLEF